MKIATDTVVTLKYTLRDESGEVIDSSDDEPLEYLHGHGQLVPGLERALEGKSQGAKFDIQVPPEDGYGEHEPEQLMEIDRADLPEDLEPEVGMELSADGPDGEVATLWIADIEGSTITLDGNHPLAGQFLNFSIEVENIRAATAEEIDHGHAHGEDDDHTEH